MTPRTVSWCKSIPVAFLPTKPCCTDTECKVCLDSDFYDLWRSCGDCNITYLEPECEMSCEFCLAGEGEDTAKVPAPRANQQIAIPAAGCSVVRRDFQLECDPLSVGHCGEAHHRTTAPVSLSQQINWPALRACKGKALLQRQLACYPLCAPKLPTFCVRVLHV